MFTKKIEEVSKKLGLTEIEVAKSDFSSADSRFTGSDMLEDGFELRELLKKLCFRGFPECGGSLFLDFKSENERRTGNPTFLLSSIARIAAKAGIRTPSKTSRQVSATMSDLEDSSQESLGRSPARTAQLMMAFDRLTVRPSVFRIGTCPSGIAKKEIRYCYQ